MVGGAGDPSPPSLFTELLELVEYKDGKQEWKELARWIKFQEIVEEEGNRWSKPHVPTPSLQGILQLRSLLKTGTVLLDLEADKLLEITTAVTDVLVGQGDITKEESGKLAKLWMRKHRHQFEGPRKETANLTAVIKSLLVQKLESKSSPRMTRRKMDQNTALSAPVSVEGSRRGSNIPNGMNGVNEDKEAVGYSEKSSPEVIKRKKVIFDEAEEDLKEDNNMTRYDDGKINYSLLRKLPSNTEASIILEGEVKFLEKPISVFIRLSRPIVLGDLPEVDIPTRFLYLVCGPPRVGDKDINYAQVGMALASAMSDKNFSQDAYEAEDKNDLVDGIDEYLESVKTLPRDWKKENHIEPPAAQIADKLKIDEDVEIDEDRRNREASGLVRTGKICGGLLNDIKRKKRHYISDFTDGLHPQCISSFLFLFFARLAPIIAFGALLGKATEERMATMESLIAGTITGIGFGLFSGQPLIILGSTGPVYIFEKILYQTCTDQEWDYLSLRLWIGIWIGFILIVLVICDASVTVCYITRFTEELFATLIAFIFIVNAFTSVSEINEKQDFNPHGNNLSCSCSPPQNITEEIDWSEIRTKDMCVVNGGTPIGEGCNFQPNVFLMSIILFFFAFVISIVLKNFKTSGYFPSTVRHVLADFAVIIAIFVMTGVDFLSDVETPKLEVPADFKPTFENRSWVVTHALMFPDHINANPIWVDVFLAPVFAVLATILIFMDQQITAVIVNRKDYKLQKGTGYHLDLLVLAILIIFCSVFGLPWFVAATVESINHLQSLAKESKTSVPGEKPEFLGIREQRVTAVLIGACTGLSVFMTPVLMMIPMPVLYGVFLYMGVSALQGMQFFERIKLLFMPHKYQPNYVYLKYVPVNRVHLFTLIQLLSLVVLWTIKSVSITSISFPVLLVVICAIRKLIECIFTRKELRALDDLLPENTKARRTLGQRLRSLSKTADFDDTAEGQIDLLRNEAELQLSTQVKKHKKKDIQNGDIDELMMANLRTRPAKTRSAMSPPKYQNGFSAPTKTILIYLRRSTQEVFTPVHLTPVTIRNLKSTLKQKFPAFQNLRIDSLMQKNKKNITFILDDAMLEYINNHDVFVMQEVLSEKEDTYINIVLEEQ